MWKKFQKRISKLPPVIRSLYFIAGILFIVWMLFMDDNNLFNQYRRRHELSVLTEKRKFYIEQIDHTQKELSELTSNTATQEKFAREHYWMKRDNEDIFIIVKKQKTNP